MPDLLIVALQLSRYAFKRANVAARTCGHPSTTTSIHTGCSIHVHPRCHHGVVITPR